jgi:hypothetical protein
MMADGRSSQPRRWNNDELSRQRRRAIDGFVAWWKDKGNAAYQRHFGASLGQVQALFGRSDDLLAFGPQHLIGTGRIGREVIRYLAGPPLSEDDLRILAGASGDPAVTGDEAIIRVISGVLDPLRFPWLFDPRGPRRPTEQERDTALRWTAGLLAAQKAATERRTDASRRQEQAVEDVLLSTALSFRKVPPRTISSPRDFLAPGEFCRQSSVGGTRDDLTIGLSDRLLVIECKVSNSEVNSYKRLNHEVGNKAASWVRAFGQGVIPAAVLDGVFKLENLERAQAAGIAIFWEHDLRPLADFVLAAR